MIRADYPAFASVPEMLGSLSPAEPVYCIYPEKYRAAACAFTDGFPGRVLYAVKVNDDARVLSLLHEGGIRHFDCASIPEIRLVKENCPGSKCYFMIPVWLRSAAREAFEQYGVRHFVVDHIDGLETLASEVPMGECVVFVRMGISHKSAFNDLSRKFGASPKDMPGLLEAVEKTGAEPALAFNVGSAVTDPDAYRQAIETARAVVESLPFGIRLLDIGGGYPVNYPGFKVPELTEYWATVRKLHGLSS